MTFEMDIRFGTKRADEIIGLALSDTDVFRGVRDAAYLHPNGFAKIPLSTGADGSVLRLHYWRGGLVQDANVHSHRWDMQSHILRGSYRARDFEEAKGGEPVNKFRCGENRSGSYELELVGPTFLKLAVDRSYGPGDTYSMSANVIHSIDHVLTSDAISLVTCSPNRFDHSWVYAPPASAPVDLPPRSIEAGLLEWILAQALQELCTFSAR